MMQGAWILTVPVLFPFAAGIACWLIGRKSEQTRNVCVVLSMMLECIVMTYIAVRYRAASVDADILGVCGLGLHFTIDGFRILYGILTAWMWLVAGVFSKEYMENRKNQNRYYLFFLLTLGAVQGIFLASDLYTVFIFFEIMSFTSYVWVAQEETAHALRAAETYLGAAVIGGMVTLMGLFLLYHESGTLVIDELYRACSGKNVYIAAICIFIGFGVKAGTFPLHFTLPKAYPAALAPESALLSAILSKNGLVGILIISCQILLHDALWGSFVLLVGVLTMTVGAVLALFSVELKHTLACSSVSQIGFILVGIGMQGMLETHNALAVQGTFLHMLNHSLFKLVLFLTAGAICMKTHKQNLNDIRGFGRGKPLLAVLFLCGGLGISGIPLFSGYVSKTLLHESIVEYAALLHAGQLTGYFTVGTMKLIEWLFLISGGLTVAYMCKLFIALFVEKNQEETVQKQYDAIGNRYLSKTSRVLLLISALLIPVLGIFPRLMDTAADFAKGYFNLEQVHIISYFSLENLSGACISIAIGIVVYLTVVRHGIIRENRYRALFPKWLDLENLLFRPVLLKLLPTVLGGLCAMLDRVMDITARAAVIIGGAAASFLDAGIDTIVIVLRKTVYKDSPEPTEAEEGNALTRFFGRIANRIAWLLNLFVRRDDPNTTDYEHKYALAYESFKENTGLIARSLSYGLILFCIGLLMTLIYLFTVLLGF